MERKRFRFIFKAKTGYYKRVVHSTCTEEELQSCKEAWAMIIETEIGVPVVCEEITVIKNN